MIRAAFPLIAFVAFVVGLSGWPPRHAFADAPIPALTHRVTDTTATLTDAQRDALDAKLAAFEARKGSQIAVLVVPSTEPETIEQYGIRVAEAWKIGRERVDDGALLIVAKNDRRLRIEVGYGLEGALTDATSRRIVDEVIVPHFRNGDFYGGIDAGLDSMMRVIDGEPLAPPRQRSAQGEGIGRLLPVLFVVAIAAGGFLRALLGRFPGALATGGLVGLIAWLFSGALLIAVGAGIIALFFTLVGGGLGAYAGGRYIGGRSGRPGNSGRDIFRGGGGGFGGGGASGRW